MNIIAGILRFYVDGFRNMTVGKKLWTIIIIKLAIIFGLLKIFFFPDYLSQKADNDDEKADAVRSELIDPSRNY